MEKKPYRKQITENVPKGLTKKQKYYYAKDHNLCTYCFAPNDNQPFARCKACCEINEHNSKIRIKEHREKGLCYCGRERVEGKAKCASCLEKTRISMEKHRKTRIKKGICRICGNKLDPIVDVHSVTGNPLKINCRTCEDKRQNEPSYKHYYEKKVTAFRKLKKWEIQTDDIEKMALYNTMEEMGVSPMKLGDALGVNSMTILRWVFHEKTKPARDMRIAINRYFEKPIYKVVNILEGAPLEQKDSNGIDQMEKEINEGIMCERCWRPINDNKVPGHARKCIFCERQLQAEENKG